MPMSRLSLRFVTLGVATPVVALFGLAALAGLYRGADAALALIFVGFLGASIMLARNLRLLVAWARQPVGTPAPQGEGLWGQVFAELGGRIQRECEVKERLSAELGRFQQAAMAMPDGVIYLGEDDLIEWMNPMAEQHFDLDRRNDLRAPLQNLVRQPEFVAYLRSTHPAEPLVMHPARRRDRSLQIEVVPLAAGRRMVLSRDVSQLERLENMRRDFVANVSHELRTPLTVVGGFLETLIDGLDDFSREDVVHFLTLASEQSTRMQRLIEELLTLSALETGAPGVGEAPVDVSELVDEVFRETELLSAGRHEIRLALDGGANCSGVARSCTVRSPIWRAMRCATRLRGGTSRSAGERARGAASTGYAMTASASIWCTSRVSPSASTAWTGAARGRRGAPVWGWRSSSTSSPATRVS